MSAFNMGSVRCQCPWSYALRRNGTLHLLVFLTPQAKKFFVAARARALALAHEALLFIRLPVAILSQFCSLSHVHAAASVIRERSALRLLRCLVFPLFVVR